jgi:hypothetical protein
VFSKIGKVREVPLPVPVVPVPVAAPVPRLDLTEDVVADGRVGNSELRILGFGLIAAVLVYALPFTRYVFSTLITLFHELGHAIAGWLLGHPSLPAFDFVYGGGFTHQGQFRPSLAVAVAALFAYGIWIFRENKKTVALVVAVALVWLVIVSSEWRREIVIAAAGHLFEFILAGVLFYQALSGVGWRMPEVERPLGAFVAFFVQIHSMLFALRLMNDPDFMAWYREGKGGALMNDLEVVALDLQIHMGINPGIEGVAKLLLLFSFIPIAAGLVWYFERARWHRVLRSLRTAES